VCLLHEFPAPPHRSTPKVQATAPPQNQLKIYDQNFDIGKPQPVEGLASLHSGREEKGVNSDVPDNSTIQIKDNIILIILIHLFVFIDLVLSWFIIPPKHSSANRVSIYIVGGKTDALTGSDVICDI
jgi:hypothetical protein